jgi:L-cystine transport system ATP-binding protein
VVDVLGRLAQDGTTMVMATHDLRLASRIANDVIFLEAGSVVETGKAGVIFTSPQQERTRRFISTISAAQTPQKID